jgi:hypothetical protein
MTDEHASDMPIAGEPHGPGTHGEGHGHDDGHDDGHAADAHGHADAHAEESLGPIDWSAWGAGVLGVILGLAVAWCFVLATAYL